MTIGDFCERIAKLCAEHDCSVTSWIRSPSRNTRVGGVAHSQHQLAESGKACDLVPDENTPTNRAKLMIAAEEAGLRGIDETDHVHVQAPRT